MSIQGQTAQSEMKLCSSNTDELFRLVTVREFLTFKKNKAQLYDNGNGGLSKRNVMALIPKIEKCLRDGGKVTVTNDERILKGNHRHEAAKIAVDTELLDPEFTFSILQYTVPLSPQMESEIAYADNFLNATISRGAHQINGEFEISRKIFRPIYEVLSQCGWELALTQTEREKLTRNMGAFLNNNPSMARNIMAGERVDISGSQIYTAKKLPETKGSFYEAKVNVYLNNRDFRLSFGELLEPAIEILQALRRSPKWDMFASANRSKINMSVIYIIIAAAMRGEAKLKAKEKGTLSLRRIENAISGPMRDLKKVRNAMLDHCNRPEVSEAVLLNYFASDN